MSVCAKLSPRARHDLEKIHSRIASNNSEAADFVRDAVLGTADFLAQNPDAGQRIQNAPPRHRETRWFVVTRFRNYLVFYRPFQDSIMVLRVLHASQDWTRYFPKAGK
jgi:plasmid stabilization system protein ParE